ncbi:SUKH-3 domain-containing protein, partial [Vibrio azureus]
MQKKTEEYLTSIGWSSERMVELPEEYSDYSINDNAKSILRNIYGLTLITKTGHKRSLRLTSKNFEFSKRHVEEMIEDYKLPLDLCPIGSLSEFGGYLYIDKQGGVYYLDGELLFLGSNLDEFIEAIVFYERKMIGIDEPEPCCCVNYPEEIKSQLTPS